MKGKRQKKIVAFILALAFVVSVPVQSVQAKEVQQNESTVPVTIATLEDQEYDMLGIKPRTTMLNCDIIMAFRTEGLVMSFTTSSLGTASVIGVKDIKVQQKMWYGWKTVLASDGGEIQNDSAFAGTLTYEGAENNKTYRVICTHYANVDVYEEFVNDTGAFKFII